MIRASLASLRFCISHKGAGLYIKRDSVSVSKSVDDSAFESLERVGVKARDEIAKLSDATELQFSLKAYWALLSLLAFREGRRELGKKFFSYSGTEAYKLLEIHWLLRFLIKILGIRYGSLLWELSRHFKHSLR